MPCAAQIKAQLAWIRVVQKVVRPRIDIATEDVDAELEPDEAPMPASPAS